MNLPYEHRIIEADGETDVSQHDTPGSFSIVLFRAFDRSMLLLLLLLPAVMSRCVLSFTRSSTRGTNQPSVDAQKQLLKRVADFWLPGFARLSQMLFISISSHTLSLAAAAAAARMIPDTATSLLVVWRTFHVSLRYANLTRSVTPSKSTAARLGCLLHRWGFRFSDLNSMGLFFTAYFYEAVLCVCHTSLPPKKPGDILENEAEFPRLFVKKVSPPLHGPSCLVHTAIPGSYAPSYPGSYWYSF